MNRTLAVCANCKRSGTHVTLNVVNRDDLRNKQNKTYWGVGRIPRNQTTVHLCGHCYRYLLEGSNCPGDYWPAMVYAFLAYGNPVDEVAVTFRDKWKLIPRTWRHWWIDEFQLSNEDGSEPSFVDLTEELEEVEGAIKELKWRRLATNMDKHFAYPEVRCPWGCSEFLHRVNKLPLKDFLWCFTNYGMKCYQAPNKRNWTDYISPSYPSSCLILEKFVCSPALAMTDDGPMILCCREHSFWSTKAYLHIPESPTGTMYTPNSNAFAPVTIRCRTNRSFKPNVFSDTFCSAKQVGGYGGLDTGYMTSENMPSKSDALSCVRDAVAIQGRPDIRAQVSDRCSDPTRNDYMSKEAVERLLQSCELRCPDPSELPECQTSTFVDCESAVKLQEQVYGEGSRIIKVYDSSTSGSHSIKKFEPPWPSHFVQVHPSDGHGQRFLRVLNTDLGVWMLLCITGRVSDVWEALSDSVTDNRGWIGHWLNFAYRKLGFRSARRCASKIFPPVKKVEDVLGYFPLTNGDSEMMLRDALMDLEAARNLFLSCKAIHVVEEYFSEVEHGDEDLGKWKAVFCVNPDFDEISRVTGQLFELRCLISAERTRPTKEWDMYVRHSGQKFWVQRGHGSPSRMNCDVLEDRRCWRHAKIAVFCRRNRVESEGLKRRYLSVIGGQSQIYCGVHNCPLVLNYQKKTDDTTHKCIFRIGEARREDQPCQRCNQFGSYICPRFHACRSAICDGHLREGNNACRDECPESVLFISPGGTYMSRRDTSEDGAFAGAAAPEMEMVPLEALGPTAAHEIAQDTIYDDQSEGLGSGGSSQDGSVTIGHVSETWSDDEAFESDAGLQTPERGHPGEEGVVVLGTEQEEDNFNTRDMFVTTTGTDQREIAIENYDDSGNKIPLCVLLNQMGHLLTRTSHKIRMNKKHKYLCQRLVSKDNSKVVPLVYAEAQLFADIFWQSLEDGTIPGAMPTALWTDSQTLNRLGIASMREHCKQRLTNPALLTSVDPAYHFMLLDQLSNLGARGKHTRLVMQRGFADHQGKDGVTFREKSDAAELYGETCENHANVHKLTALVRERNPHYFFTQTCNQKTCRGLRMLREWTESEEAAIHVHRKYGLQLGEASRVVRETAASFASRSWNETMDLWMRYIIFSPEEPLGPIDYAWYRKEFQDTQGNLSHLHSILRTKYDVTDPSQLQIVLDKIRGCIRELITAEERQEMETGGLISSEGHLLEILEQAKSYLTHRCHSRCQIPRMTDENGETFYVCKVKDNYFRTMTPQVHTFQQVRSVHTPEATSIYNRLGMMLGDVVIEPDLQAAFHVPVSSREDCKFSPTNGYLFVMFPSSQNIQFTTGHTISSYLIKYVTKVDDVARVQMKPPGRADFSPAKAVIEQLHNTKITSNKIMANKTRKKDVNYGRPINHTECFDVLLGQKLVESTVEFKHYSTAPREYRSAYFKTSKPNFYELEDYVATVVCVGQEVRQEKSFESHRLFSQEQLEVIFDETSSSITSDAITQFSLRPPEIRFVNQVRLYTRWFLIEPVDFRSSKILDIKQRLTELLDRDLAKCRWIDGMNNQIVLRRGAISEMLVYAEGCDACLLGGRNGKAKMVTLLRQMDKLHRQFASGDFMDVDGGPRSRPATLESSRRQYQFMCRTFWACDESTSLPVPWTTPVYPKNRGRFLIHILLMFGEFETEYGLMAHETMRDAYIHAGLFDPERGEQSFDELLARYVRECLCFQPGSVYLRDRNLVFAQAAFSECLLNTDSDVLMGTPCVLQSAMLEETTGKINKEKQKLLSAFINALYSDLVKAGFPPSHLPDRAAIESLYCYDKNLMIGNVGNRSSGNVSYKFPPDPIPDGPQCRASYIEQTKVLEAAKIAVQRFLNGYSHKNLVVCGGPGNGKTTVCQEICLYAFSKGLKGIATSIVADRSKALGGMHIHLLCSLQPGERNGVSPGNAAEAAVAHIIRTPELLHFWRELQFIYLDELGAVSSEMLATMDIIARHLKDSSRFMGGILVIASMDVFQLLPIEGTALMLSMNMMTEFQFMELTESVRAARDPNLRRLCKLTRTKTWTDELRQEFRSIITDRCTFLESFSDPLTPEDGIYVFGRKNPCQTIEHLLIERMKNEGKVELVLSKAQDEESSIAGNWKVATKPVSQELSRKLKRKEDLFLFEKGRYEFTYNKQGAFQQGQLAILLEVNKNDVEKQKNIRFYKGPPGCKEFPPLSDFNISYLRQHGWEAVNVPFETSKPTRVWGRMVGRRTQYGVRLRIASTIHASQGATFGKLITSVTNETLGHGDLNFLLWEAAQVVVLLSRTRMCQDLYFVGTAEEVVPHLLAVLEMKSKFLEHITSMTGRLCSRDNGSEAIDRPPLFRPCDFILDDIPGVYLLVSTRHYGYFYIGETKSLRKRLNDHNSGRGSKFTNNQHLRPWALFGYVYGFLAQDKRRLFENSWKRAALERWNRQSTTTPMGMLSIAEGLVAVKNRSGVNGELRVQRCGSYEVRFRESCVIVNST